MNLQTILSIVKTYSFVDIDNSDGTATIRKQLSTGELTEELLRSYLLQYNAVKLVPKKMNGNSPIRIVDEAIKVDAKILLNSPVAGLSGLDSPGTVPTSNANADLYRIMYENAKEEAREYKRKYEDAINDKHKAELELAGSKNSVVGDLAQGLAGIAPMLLGANGGMAGLGNATPSAQPSQPSNAQPVSDMKLKAIIQYYTRLDDASKQKVYDLLAKVFADLSKIDQLLTV